jgi:hypothetical protein
MLGAMVGVAFEADLLSAEEASLVPHTDKSPFVCLVPALPCSPGTLLPTREEEGELSQGSRILYASL